jgi:glutathione S-transferase
MAEIEIYSASVCPFAQRSRLVLLEKDVDFKLIEIDLQNKPEGLQRFHPTAKYLQSNMAIIAFGNRQS